MIAGFSSLWFWGPIIGAILLAVIFVVAAYRYNARKCPRTISENFFNGPVRNWVVSGGGAAISLLPIILSAEIRKDPVSLSILGAAAVLFLVSMIVGLWLYTSVQSLQSPQQGAVIIPSPFWVAVQGAVFAWLIVAIVSLLLFVVFSPVLGPNSGMSAKSGVSQSRK